MSIYNIYNILYPTSPANNIGNHCASFCIIYLLFIFLVMKASYKDYLGSHPS